MNCTISRLFWIFSHS